MLFSIRQDALSILLCSLSDRQLMHALVCTGTKLSRRKETRGMTLANSDQERLTPTLRPNLPDPTLLTWTKMVSSAQLIQDGELSTDKFVSKELSSSLLLLPTDSCLCVWEGLCSTLLWHYCMPVYHMYTESCRADTYFST